MSDTQVIMKFELLPNEMLIECFEYLNSLDIFHSFDQLNYRFNRLIRTIPLHLDFENIEQSIFNQFCTKISQNPEIKKQLYSLHLSNKNACWQIQLFFSSFSFGEFIHLQSLTLTEATKNNISLMNRTLYLLTRLSYFRLIDYKDRTDEIISALPMTQLRTLMITKLPQNSRLISQFSSITNLTLFSCPLGELLRILSYASRLNYLNIQHVSDQRFFTTNNDEPFLINHAIHLKQLIIMSFGEELKNLFFLLKHTPTITSLTIGNYTYTSMIDAYQWEHLITSSLPYLNIFNFKFQCFHPNKNDGIKEKFHQFQSDFWQKQHHWYTEYSISDKSALVYTIPYISNEYTLKLISTRYSNEMINNVNTSDNVIDLTINPNVLSDKCQYYFSHVTSIILESVSILTTNPLLITKHMKFLKMIVNLSNVKHLDISHFRELESPSVILEILKEATQISSLAINPDSLLSLLKDNELCKYLNQMITDLKLYRYCGTSFSYYDDLNQFCEIFSNIEQLTCTIDDYTSLLFLTKHLPKLSRLNIINSSLFNTHYGIFLMKEELQKLDIRLFADFDDTNSLRLSIRIIRDI